MCVQSWSISQFVLVGSVLFGLKALQPPDGFPAMKQWVLSLATGRGEELVVCIGPALSCVWLCVCVYRIGISSPHVGVNRISTFTNFMSNTLPRPAVVRLHCGNLDVD